MKRIRGDIPQSLNRGFLPSSRMDKSCKQSDIGKGIQKNTASVVRQINSRRNTALILSKKKKKKKKGLKLRLERTRLFIDKLTASQTSRILTGILNPPTHIQVKSHNDWHPITITRHAKKQEVPRKSLAISLNENKLKDLGNQRILQNRVPERRKLHKTLGDLQRFQGVLMNVYL